MRPDVQKMDLAELAELLIRIGEELKARKAIEGPGGAPSEPRQRREPGVERPAPTAEQLLGALPLLDRSEAEEKLKAARVRDLEYICKQAGVPFRAKQTSKGELVQRLLRHFFDFPSGRDILQRFATKDAPEVVAFREARVYFETHRESLLIQYEGKYVAILNGRVIDSDTDFSQLAERVYRREGYRDIFMPRVERRPSVLMVPSPRVNT